MASDENESALFAAAREPPPRALTRVSPMVRRLVAPNASPFTFNGTCTYIVGEGEVAIVDPGPGDDSHLAALLAAVEGERVDAILVTHTHRDHSVGVNKLRSATGAQVIGAAPFMPRGDGSTGLDASHDRDYSPDAILADGDRWQGHGYTIEAIATPGHCSNHLCFALLEEGALFSERPCYGVVDVSCCGAGRFDARLHGLARQGARTGQRRSIGLVMAALSSNRNDTYAP